MLRFEERFREKLSSLKIRGIEINKKRSNLRDVARTANVSVATVSRVLNNPLLVSKTTRERVEAAVEALNFVPSAAARAINSGRSRVVGALVPTLDNSIFARFLVSLETKLSDFGLSLVVASTNDDPDVEAEKAQKMLNIGAEGLIVSGISHNESFHTLIKRASLPVVAISYFNPGYEFPTVGYDNQHAIEIAIQHLRALGHSRIAVIHGQNLNNDRTRTRINKIRNMEQVVQADFYPTEISVDGGSKAAAQLATDRSDYTAVLCFSDVLAIGVLYELQRRGISVPSEMSVMGIENLPSAAYTVPALTTIQLQVSEMGAQAATCLGRWVEDSVRPDHIRLEATLIERSSTAALGSVSRHNEAG